MDPATILALVNVIIPLATNIVVMFKHHDGTTSVIVLLDAADAQFAANQEQILKALAAKKQTP